MPDVIGTTVSLSSFLQEESLRIVIDSSLHGRQEIVLSENREYIIPSFQREIRWGIENVNILLSDLDKGAIFLGNFILTIKDGGNCEIIDGQQRTTVLVLLLTWLKEKYRDALEIPAACRINNLSFPGFQTIVDVGFDETRLSPEVFAEIISEDVYSQYPRIKKIWDLFSNSPILSTRHKVVHIIDNLRQSQVNIITNRSNENGNSIRYFLDVNLKGIHLDTEDIFKAYLIKQDSSDEIKKLWEKNKEAARKVNLAKGGKEDSRYPLMKIYEHFLYCDLYLAEQKKFANVTFGENFCLSKNTTIDGFEFYEGTHIIEVISNKAYMKKALSCALCFVASRALSGLAAVTFRSARQEGTLMQFVTPAHRRITVAVGILYATAVAAGLLLTDWFTGVAALFGMAAAFVYYRIESYRRFGGITGDLAGYFLQLCELAGMGGVVAAGFVKGAFV